MIRATHSREPDAGPIVTPFRLLAVGVLVAAWLAGGIAHARWMIATGWGDIAPGLLVLALGLVLWAGVTAWAVLPQHGRRRSGAYAGMLTFAVTVVAQFALVYALLPPERLTGGDETWFTLLLESWFWVGIPLVMSASLGAAGWRATDRLYRATHPHGRAQAHRTGR